MINQGESGLAQVVSKLLNQSKQTIVVIEQQSAGMVSYQLFEANAPIVKSEVVPFMMEEPIDYFSQILQNQRVDIALGIVNFQEKNTEFTLIIATIKQVLHFKLKYIGRSQSSKIQQQILTAIALDGLRRYLLNLPIVGPNVWLEQIA